jgi:hypothetical protein
VLLWSRRLLFVSSAVPIVRYYERVLDLGKSMVDGASVWAPAWMNVGLIKNLDVVPNYVQDSLMWGVGLVPIAAVAMVWYIFIMSEVWEWWDRLSASALLRPRGETGAGERALLAALFGVVSLLPGYVAAEYTIRGSWLAVLEDAAAAARVVDWAAAYVRPFSLGWLVSVVGLLLLGLLLALREILRPRRR